jgi:hypothetical protein
MPHGARPSAGAHRLGRELIDPAHCLDAEGAAGQEGRARALTVSEQTLSTPSEFTATTAT